MPETPGLSWLSFLKFSRSQRIRPILQAKANHGIGALQHRTADGQQIRTGLTSRPV